MRISHWSSDVCSSDLLDILSHLTYIPAVMEIETATVTPPHKGRPREFCVDMALAAELRVFWSKGYEGASMADLTEAMGITKPSLYAAFGNKEALFNKDRKSTRLNSSHYCASRIPS